MRGEISKLCASIGSCSIADDSAQCSLFNGPSTTDNENLEAIISSILGEAEIEKVNSIVSAINAGKPSGPSASTLSKLWLVFEPLAKGALDQNTQLCRQSADNIMSRQFSTNDRMLRYRRLQSVFFTDTMFATPKAKSTRGYTCCQVFVSDKIFVAVYPMKS